MGAALPSRSSEEGLAEREWEGAQLRIGDVLIRLDALRGRCVMTTTDPETLSATYRCIATSCRFDNRLALDADVGRRGTVRVGDRVVIEGRGDSVPLLTPEGSLKCGTATSTPSFDLSAPGTARSDPTRPRHDIQAA